MNTIEQPIQACIGPDVPVRTPPRVDYQGMLDVTAGLTAALAVPDDFPRLAHALHENRRLWAQLALGVADEANGVPPSLREQVCSLAEFTRRHTGLVLRDQARAEVLVDINTAILRGLAGQLLPSSPVQPMVYQ